MVDLRRAQLSLLLTALECLNWIICDGNADSRDNFISCANASKKVDGKRSFIAASQVDTMLVDTLFDG